MAVRKTFWSERLHLEGFFLLGGGRLLVSLRYCPAPGGWAWRTDHSSIITVFEISLRLWQRFDS